MEPEEKADARWFGRPWKTRDEDGDETDEIAPICTNPVFKRAKIPYGEPCIFCGEKMTANHSGVILPDQRKRGQHGELGFYVQCSDCFES